VLAYALYAFSAADRLMRPFVKENICSLGLRYTGISRVYKEDGALTTTAPLSARVILLSSQYFQPPALDTKAVSYEMSASAGGVGR
jgi:hypothetical protein